MSEDIVLQTFNAAETEQIGEDIGKRLKGGEIIELMSDLGGGKTTFTRGLVRGAGSTDHVASPTFTVSKVYKAHKFDIHHFDFYRLPEAGLLEHELSDLLGDAQTVVVVEWGDIIKHVLPKERITIEIIQTDSVVRELHIKCHESLEYLTDKS